MLDHCIPKAFVAEGATTTSKFVAASWVPCVARLAPQPFVCSTWSSCAARHAHSSALVKVLKLFRIHFRVAACAPWCLDQNQIRETSQEAHKATNVHNTGAAGAAFEHVEWNKRQELGNVSQVHMYEHEWTFTVYNLYNWKKKRTLRKVIQHLIMLLKLHQPKSLVDVGTVDDIDRSITSESDFWCGSLSIDIDAFSTMQKKATERPLKGPTLGNLIVSKCKSYILVGGFNLPLWKICVRQLGWWFPIYGKSWKPCSSHHQPVILIAWWPGWAPQDSAFP